VMRDRPSCRRQRRRSAARPRLFVGDTASSIAPPENDGQRLEPVCAWVESFATIVSSRAPRRRRRTATSRRAPPVSLLPARSVLRRRRRATCRCWWFGRPRLPSRGAPGRRPSSFVRATSWLAGAAMTGRAAVGSRSTAGVSVDTVGPVAPEVLPEQRCCWAVKPSAGPNLPACWLRRAAERTGGGSRT
jgi:hypothetical protein